MLRKTFSKKRRSNRKKSTTAITTFTNWVRKLRYDQNHSESNAVPPIQNRPERSESKIQWSTLSNVAELFLAFKKSISCLATHFSNTLAENSCSKLAKKLLNSAELKDCFLSSGLTLATLRWVWSIPEIPLEGWKSSSLFLLLLIHYYYYWSLCLLGLNAKNAWLRPLNPFQWVLCISHCVSYVYFIVGHLVHSQKPTIPNCNSTRWTKSHYVDVLPLKSLLL